MRERVYEVIAVAERGDRASLCYDYFMMFCITCSIIPLCFKETTALFLWMDRATAGVFILDYALRWWTADFKLPGSRTLAFLRYPLTPFAIVDLLSILPSLRVLNSGFKLFRLLRLNKALKALKFLRYSKSFSMVISVVKRESRALAAVYVLSSGYILLAALVMFQVEPDSFKNFFDAIYWSLVTLTTVGYGDIYPVSSMGRVVSMISSFVGIAIVALPTGIITAGYMHELRRREEQEKELEEKH